jgi:tetratricopeptide (TPR) repeat protein
MKPLSCIIPILGVTAAVYWVAPAYALSAPEIAKIAKQSTVQIGSASSPGSGVIIKKNGDVYTVLTAAHVVRNPGEQQQVVTPDGVNQSVQKVRIFPNQVDLAVAEFTSSKQYTVSKLAKDSSETLEGSLVYVSGFPVTASIDIAIFNFTEGKVTANSSKTFQDGYSLVYSNNTLPGHSGGPVWNDKGEVVAIHGKGDVDSKLNASEINPNIRVKTGFNLGITVNTFTQLAASVGVSGYQTVATKPTPVDDLLVSGLAKLNEGKYAESIDDFDQAIKADPKRSVAFLYRGTARNLGANSKALSIVGERGETEDQVKPRFKADYQLALKDFQIAYQLNPKSTWALEGAANTQNDLGNYAQAIKILDAAIAAKPTDNAYSIRAKAKEKSGDLPGAAADYSAAIKLVPSSAYYYGMRAGVYRQQKNYTAAIADYEQAIKINPKNALYFLERGFTQADNQQKAAALQDFTRAIELNKNRQFRPYLYMTRGNENYRQARYTAAVADFSEALRDRPQDISLLFFRAAAYRDTKQYALALADLERLLKINPQDASAYLIQGRIYLDTKRSRLALASFNRGIEIATADSKFKYTLATLYSNRTIAKYLLKDFNGALSDANQAIALDVESPNALYYRGLIKADRRDTAGAIQDLEVAAKLFLQYKSTVKYQAAIAKIQELRRRRR